MTSVPGPLQAQLTAHDAFHPGGLGRLAGQVFRATMETPGPPAVVAATAGLPPASPAAGCAAWPPSAWSNTNRIRRSMGRTGVCWDNAAAESFFAALKNEM